MPISVTALDVPQMRGVGAWFFSAGAFAVRVRRALLAIVFASIFLGIASAQTDPSTNASTTELLNDTIAQLPALVETPAALPEHDAPIEVDAEGVASAELSIGADGVALEGSFTPLVSLPFALAPLGFSVGGAGAATPAVERGEQNDTRTMSPVDVEPDVSLVAVSDVLPPPTWHAPATYAAGGTAAPQLGSVASSVADEAPSPPAESTLAPIADIPPLAPLDDSATLATVAVGVTALVGVLAGLYSRFQKHNLLRSERRARIHASVLAQPGATLADLERSTGLGRGALVHHCQMLEKNGLLASQHDGLHRRFYPPGPPPGPQRRPPTRSESRVLDVIGKAGPLTQRELAELLGVSAQAVSQQVHRLQRDGRIEVQATEDRRRVVALASAEDVSDA